MHKKNGEEATENSLVSMIDKSSPFKLHFYNT